MSTGKRGKFASIIELANQDAEPEATLEAPPEPEQPSRPEIVVMPKAAIAPSIKPAASPAASNGKVASKRSSRKQAMFYLPPALSIQLDQFVSFYNLEAAEQGLPAVDRSDLAAIVLSKLVELGDSKGRIKALRELEKLK